MKIVNNYFYFLLISLLLLNTNIKAQIIDEIIEKILVAQGGREIFTNTNNIYREGFIFNLGEEDDSIETLVKNNKYVNKFKEYFMPFVGKREETYEMINGKKIIDTKIFTNKDGWVYAKEENNDDFVSLAPLPKYIFYANYYSLNKFAFNNYMMINNYSTSKNTIYYGYQLISGKRYIKLICNNTNIVYVDEETSLPYRVVTSIYDPKTKITFNTEYTLEDYKKINTGLILPFVVTEQVIGASIGVVYKANIIEANKIENSDELLNTKDLLKKYKKFLITNKQKINIRDSTNKK